MSRRIFTMLAGAILGFATFAGAQPAFAGCNEDVADAFAKQRKLGAFRMKTRQLSAQGLVYMSVDYLLPYKMHQSLKPAVGPGKSELILVGTRAWYSTGLQWSLMSEADTKSLNKQFGASVIDPPKDPLKYECLGRMTVDGQTVIGYQGKEGETETAKTASIVLRTVFVDPETGLPTRTTVARASKPDLAFFKADYSYPTDIVIEPPKDVKPSKPSAGGAKPKPNQSTAPKKGSSAQ